MHRRERGGDAQPSACLRFKRGKEKPAPLPNGKRKPNYAPLVLSHPHLRTRLPTQTRFPTPREISRAIRGTSPSALFSRRGGEQTETEARLFIPGSGERQPGRIEIPELCQRRESIATTADTAVGRGILLEADPELRVSQHALSAREFRNSQKTTLRNKNSSQTRYRCRHHQQPLPAASPPAPG